MKIQFVKTKPTIIDKTIAVCLFLYVFLAVLHTLYNLWSFSKSQQMLFLTSEEREKITFGNFLLLSEIVAESVPFDQPLLIHTKEGSWYFYLRYLLYPREIYWANDKARDLSGINFSYNLYIGDEKDAFKSLHQEATIIFEDETVLLTKKIT